MKIVQNTINSKEDAKKLTMAFDPDVIFLFVSLSYKNVESTIRVIEKKFKKSIIIGGTTAGEIIDKKIVDDSIVLSAIQFKTTKLRLYTLDLQADVNTYQHIGKQFIRQIHQEDLRHIFLLSDVQTLNASKLLKGINDELSSRISVTGGLAGRDSYMGSNFIINGGKLKRNQIIGLAMYGEDLHVNYNAQGGWDSYGVECLVTKAKTNRLIEIDGQPALDFYKEHIHAHMLYNVGKQGFKHPIKVRNEEHSNPVIRALLDIDEKEKSLIMAEEIPVGSYVRIMKANNDRLITGAENAAKTIATQNKHHHELAILISCSGRRKVLGNLASEEVEAVMDQFSEHTKSIGFYSYGEISPFYNLPKTSLHNLTMCVTTFSEI